MLETPSQYAQCPSKVKGPSLPKTLPRVQWATTDANSNLCIQPKPLKKQFHKRWVGGKTGLKYRLKSIFKEQYIHTKCPLQTLSFHQVFLRVLRMMHGGTEINTALPVTRGIFKCRKKKQKTKKPIWETFFYLPIPSPSDSPLYSPTLHKKLIFIVLCLSLN